MIKLKRLEKKVNKVMELSKPVEVISYNMYVNFATKERLLEYTVYIKGVLEPINAIYVLHQSLDFNVGIAVEKIRVSLANQKIAKH